MPRNLPHISKPHINKEISYSSIKKKAEPQGLGLLLAAGNIAQADRLPVTKCMMNEITAKMMSR